MANPQLTNYDLPRAVLYQPEIPQNFGNIARTTAALASEVHLIRPLGFSLSESRLRRAGLDYWPHVKYFLHDSWEAFLAQVGTGERILAFTAEGHQTHFQVEYQHSDWLLFGSEDTGLPQELRQIYQSVRIPMPGPVRSLNLAVSVAVVLYEAFRQAELKKSEPGSGR